VAAGRRARLVLPAELIFQLDAAQRKALLLHELLHLKRGDHRMRFFELVVRVAFWWLPPVRSLSRQLRVCEELCCDAAVVEHMPQARREYARLLLDVLDFADPMPAGGMHATAMSAAPGLESRLHRILSGRRERKGAGLLTALTVLAACALLPCAVRYEIAADELSGMSPLIKRPEQISPMCCPRIAP
jgi:beta-lactamase regulating signal transducer with metallopeptidase domain